MHNESFEHFFDEGLIEAVIAPLKHGKEASVHLCRANPRTTPDSATCNLWPTRGLDEVRMR